MLDISASPLVTVRTGITHFIIIHPHVAPDNIKRRPGCDYNIYFEYTSTKDLKDSTYYVYTMSGKPVGTMKSKSTGLPGGTSIIWGNRFLFAFRENYRFLLICGLLIVFSLVGCDMATFNRIPCSVFLFVQFFNLILSGLFAKIS